jgi:hypothetical protein
MTSVAKALVARRRRAQHSASMKARIAAKAKATRHKHRALGHKVGTKAQVYKGVAHHTKTGLKKKDIVRVKVGMRAGKVLYRYKSARKHRLGKRGKTGNVRALRAWRMALRQVTGGRIPKKGTADYAAAKEVYLRLLQGARIPLGSLKKGVRRVKKAGARRAKKAGPRRAKKAGPRRVRKPVAVAAAISPVRRRRVRSA